MIDQFTATSCREPLGDHRPETERNYSFFTECFLGRMFCPLKIQYYLQNVFSGIVD